MTERRDHYSYTVYANPETARRFEVKRFGGPIGQMVAATEAAAFSKFSAPVAGQTVLDVGTGTGRIALLMDKAGATVTGIDASEEMLKVARQQAAAQGADVTFLAGDAHHLAFPDRSFDVVVSSRVLMHTPEWQMCVDEWCRVARHRVILDYPSARSFALFHSLWRRTRHGLVGTGRQPYRVFFDRQIAAAFRRNGFVVRSKQRNFVVPIGVYRLIGSRNTAELTENALRQLGITRLVASPVTVLAERA